MAALLVMVPALSGLEPVAAEPSEVGAQVPEGGAPVLSVPEESGPPVPEYTPREDGALAFPEDWDGPEPAGGYLDEEELPERVRELPEKRDATREVWENADGTETVEIHSEPIHFRPEGGEGWERIDNRLVPVVGRPGWVTNAANSWDVSFGPIEAGGRGGMELRTDAGPTRAVPELPVGRGTIAPVVGTGDEADTVTYRGVWPGVDVVYTVAGGLVKEDIVVHSWGAGPTQASFRFVVEGMGLVDSETSRYSPAAPAVTGVQEDQLGLVPVEVLDGEGHVVGEEARADIAIGTAGADVADAGAVPGAAQRVTVSVSPTWLTDQLATGSGPVVIDPTVVIGAWSYSSYDSNGAVCSPCRPVLFGNDWFGGDDRYARSIFKFDYWTPLQGKELKYADVHFSEYVGNVPALTWVGAFAAGADSFDGAIGYGVLEGQGSVDSTGGAVPISGLIGGWHYLGVQNGKIGIAGDETPEAHTMKRFNMVTLRLIVNTRPPAPAPVTPEDKALAITTTTPTLSWSPVTDADGDQVTYTAKIATGADGESGLVATSSPGSATSWQVPAGVLRDGVAYYWAVWAKDTQGSYTKSAVRQLTVDRRSGLGGISPTDSFGGVSTNLVTGNAALSVNAPEMTTVGGGVGVDFVYNSQTDLAGLRGEYRTDADKDHVIDTTDPVVLTRIDPQISFAWVPPSEKNPNSSPHPSPGVPEDWFTVRWTGYVTLPAGTRWQFGRRSDDGMKIWIDGNKVVDGPGGPINPDPDYQTGSFEGATTHQIAVEFYEGPGDAQAELWARNADNPTEQLIVPATWLSQEPQVLPNGWTLQAADLSAEYTRAQVSDSTVTLTLSDGSTLAFTKKPGGGGYTPPEGIDDIVTVNADGTVTVLSDDGSTYVFRTDGALDRITSALDDRKPAAAQPGYDSLGRLTSLKDPVSGRSITFIYAGSGSCTTTPPFPGASGFTDPPTGMLCRVNYWDGTTTELYYKNGYLSYVRNPGDAYEGFGYDETTGRLSQHVDPLAFDAAFTGVPDWDVLYTKVGYDPQGRVSTVALPPRYGSRMTRTYSYAPNVAGSGVLIDGNASVARSNMPGTFRTVTYDQRARTTTETDAAGETTHTTWNPDDQVTSVEGPDGLRTTTIYNNLKRPTDTWGPAPASMFNADGTGQAGVPHEVTRYDEGLDGLQAVWWNNATQAGTPLVHNLWPGQLRTDFPAGSLPAGLNADNVSARFSSQIVFPTVGDYQLGICVGPYDKGTLTVDNKTIGHVDASASSQWANCDNTILPTTVKATAAGEAQRLSVDYTDLSGNALLHLNWKRPDGTLEGIPATALKPDLGLVTSTVAADGKTTRTEYIDAAAGIGPQHGVATKATVDAGGLNLTETTGYEPGGSGYLRRISRTLPAGPDTKTTHTYYGDTELRDNPCTLTADPANQGGLLKLDTAADPDGTGPQQPIVRENVYDNSGRVVATRIGTEPWTCTTYDTRGRVVETRYPAFGGEPARTVTNNYAADPDGPGPLGSSPLVQTVTDDAGTIQTELDILGEPIFYTDVFGHKTTYWYDDAGRQWKTDSPVGQIAKAFDNADRLTSVSRNGQTVASGITYGPGGRLDSVTYPAGEGNAGNATTGTFRYNNLGRLDKVTWTDPAGGVITSDEVTRNTGGDIINQIVDGVDHHPGDDYVYDNANRLTEAWVPGRHVSFRYDPTGGCGSLATAGANTNRTAQIIEGGPTTNYCYDRADRLTSASDTAVGTLVYDAHGNTTEVFGETHSYDALDRHIATTKGDTTVAYTRDATDRIVERRVNGNVVARYGSTGTGDISDFTTDANNVLQEVNFPLPGGALLTTRATGNVWSYPNIHGDIVATTDQAGTKQGPTRQYDPYGNLIAGDIPDNSAGNLDYGWLGQHQRPLEYEADLQPIIEMGARQYSPLLGRFLEVDPVEGGSAHDYDYVNADPINDTDLAGTWPGQGLYKKAKKWGGKKLKSIKKVAKKAGRLAWKYKWDIALTGAMFIPGGAAIGAGFKAYRIVRAARALKGMGGGLKSLRVTSRIAGRAWTGFGSRATSIGGRMSRNGLRQWRPPTFKPKLGVSQSNFESRAAAKGPWTDNYHVRH